MRSSADHSSTFAECGETSAEWRKAVCPQQIAQPCPLAICSSVVYAMGDHEYPNAS